MKNIAAVGTLCLLASFARGEVLHFSESKALNVTIPDSWYIDAIKPPRPGFPFSTFPIRPKGDRNAACLLSVYSKNDARALDDAFLRQLLTGDSAPLIANSPDRRMAEIHHFVFDHGTGDSASFVDARLVGKPVKKRDYKTTTVFIVCIDRTYLTKITVLCDSLDSDEYTQCLAIIQSLSAAQK